MRKKTRRLLAGILAVVFLLSSIQMTTLTANAEEVTQQDVGLDNPTNADDVTDPNMDPNTDPNADPNVDPNADPNVDPNADPNVDPNADPNVDPNANPEETPIMMMSTKSSNEVIYTFDDLTRAGGYSCEMTEDTDDVWTFAYSGGSYGELYFNFPSDFDSSKVSNVELVIEEGSGVQIKLYPLENAKGYQTNEYGGAADYEMGETIAPSYQFKSIGITSPSDKNTVKISGVKITMDDSLSLPARTAPEEPEAPEETGKVGTVEKVYSLGGLTQKAVSNVTATHNEASGSMKLDFTAQYGEVDFEIPTDIDFSKVKKVSITLKSGSTGSLAMKTYTQADWDASDVYQTDVEYGRGYVIPQKDVANVKYIGICSTATGENSVLIESITFTVEGSYTYTASSLEEQGNNSVSVTNNDGEEVLTFAGQYNEIDYKVPADVDFSKVKKVIFNMNEGESQGLALKTYTQADWDAEGVYQTDADYNGTGILVPAKDIADVKYIGISNNTTETKSITLKSITFVFDEASSVGVNPDAEDSEGGIKVFTADDLTFSWADPDEEGAYEKADGKLVVNFKTKQYAQVAFNIPESINLANCTEIKFTLADQTAPVALKLLKNGTEVEKETRYGQNDATEYVFAPNTAETINGVGIMYDDGTPVEGETASVVSVAFTMKGSSDVSYGDNIIKNPNFAEDDFTMWSEGVKKATISRGTSDTAIFDDITTYGIIDRDATWLEETQDARHEFFMQDITKNVEIGSEYKVEFYAMLSEDYAGADADQRVVEFAPYFETADGPKYLGASYSSQLSGNLSQTLEAGKWTKYEGTFNVTHDADIDKVVIRVIEQGTEYGDVSKGQCVKGDYYITGVSMKKIVKPETTIENDIPNWKDAITGAFGDDAIAGTCLGSGTITYKYLQDLAKKHFNAITFENEQKPDATLGSTPNIGEDGYPIYNFTTADRMMKQIHDWNVANEGNFKIRGHVLVWHSQTPEWFFHENYDANQPYVDAATMNARMEHYIKSVFEHYNSVVYDDGSKASDLFYGWDVVNEAISDSTAKPRMASENSSWAAVYGDQSNEYIINAFRYANKYAPAHVELYYNDYNDSNEPKASGIATLLADVTSHENDADMPTRIDGVGMQAHHNFADPSVSQIKAAANKYLDALGEGGTVQMTELDVKCSSTFDGTAATLESEHNKQAWRFKEIFQAYRDIETARPGSVAGITMWGITDETSWLQSSNSVGGASSGGAQAPLLFYIDNHVAKAKPAFYAFFDEYVADLAPMIQNVTVLQQLEAGKFDSGISYNIAGVAEFVPMWTNEGLTIKVSVNDNTADGANDKITVYIDENGSKSEGDYAKATVARNASGVTSTADGYEAIINIPMAADTAKTFSMDIVVDNNGAVSIFNDKKGTQDTTSQYYAEAILKPYATVKSGTITFDCEADAKLNDVTAIPLTIVSGAEATATVKALWDANYLYVYADIRDAVLDATGAETHERDSLEVFIDENNAKSDGYEADDKQYRVNYLNEQSFNGTKCTADNIVSAVKVVDGGYVVEAAYKWTDITPSANMEIGVDFQINDAKDGARTGTASWYDESGMGWSSPGVFGTVMLVGDAGTTTGPSTGGSGSSSSGGSSSDGSSSDGSSSGSDTSTKNETTTKDETIKPTTPEVTPSVPEVVKPVVGGNTEENDPSEDFTPTISLESVVPEAIENVVEQLQTLVDEDASFEEKVEAVQEVIDTVIEVFANEEVQELAKEAVSSIEQTIKDALGIETIIEHKGEDVPEVKTVIGALLSVDAGKQPTLSVEALDVEKAPEMEEIEEGFTNGFPLDIKLYADDEEVQPNVPVTIRMGIPKGVDRDKDIKVVHFGKSGKHILDVSIFGDDMEFTTDGFSTFVVVNVESVTTGTELVTADEVADATTDNNDTEVSAIEEKADDSGFTPFIIIVIVIAILAIAVAGFFMMKNKKEE